jgi:two-component sensor histidine kinase
MSYLPNFMRPQRYRFFLFGIILFSEWLWTAIPAEAQRFSTPDTTKSSPVGNVLFTKLRKTQAEYRQAVASGDSERIAEACYLLGKRYGGLGDYMLSQRWYIRSLQIREPLGPSEGIGKAYLRLAEIQVGLKHFDEALIYVRRALVSHRKANSMHGVMGAYNVLGGVYFLGSEMNRAKHSQTSRLYSDSALYYYHQAELAALSLNKPLDIARIYYCMSDLYHLRDGPRAILYLKKALAIFTREADFYGMINCHRQLAKGYIARRQPELARNSLDQARKIADSKHAGDFLQNRDIENAYTWLYQLTGNWKLAFRHLEKAHELESININSERESAIARLSIEYETEKKESQLKAQQQELENLRTQKRLTLVTSALLAITAIMSAVFFWLYRKNRRMSRMNAVLIKEQNHRVKNNLQVISGLLSLQSNRLSDQSAKRAIEESQLRIQAMSLLHRRLYDGERLAEVNLATFIPELVGGVLQTYGFTTLQPDYELDEIWLHADKAVYLGLILNELITNSCKYAFPDHQAPVLRVVCNQTDERINLTVADNGPGFDSRARPESFGMGLIAIQTKQLKGNHHFNSDRGTTFTLTFKS